VECSGEVLHANEVPLDQDRPGIVNTATLSCGAELCYEAKSFLPASGELVPCTRHGYCEVADVGTSRRGASHWRGLPRPRPRTQDELLEWLRAHSVTSIHVLRRQRFTLRMVAAAERDGLVAVDLEAGTVAVC
jgi:hypothetical protein